LKLVAGGSIAIEACCLSYLWFAAPKAGATGVFQQHVAADAAGAAPNVSSSRTRASPGKSKLDERSRSMGGGRMKQQT
jgi:hypothetical protein